MRMKRYISKDHLSVNLCQESPGMKYKIEADHIYKISRRNPSGYGCVFSKAERVERIPSERDRAQTQLEESPK